MISGQIYPDLKTLPNHPITFLCRYSNYYIYRAKTFLQTNFWAWCFCGHLGRMRLITFSKASFGAVNKPKKESLAACPTKKLMVFLSSTFSTGGKASFYQNLIGGGRALIKDGTILLHFVEWHFDWLFPPFPSLPHPPPSPFMRKKLKHRCIFEILERFLR